KAEQGDFLRYSFNGMKDVKIKVEDITRVLNIALYPEANLLNEVVVKGKRPTQEDLKREYVENKSVIRTAYGYFDKERSSYNFRIVDLEENKYSYLCITELLRARFQELTVFGSCTAAEEEVQVLLRGRASINNPQSMIFDVDGQILTQVPIGLPMFEVKRVALFRDIAVRAKYGALGAGGVIVINTFNTLPKADPLVDTNGLDKKFQEAQLVSSTNLVNTNPIYLESMKMSSSLASAMDVFNDFESSYSSSPFFYLDSYEFFYNKGEKNFADEVMDRGYNLLFENNANMLKALAYKYQEQGRFEKANRVLKQAFILRPNYAQSYFDIGRSFRELDNPRLSAMMFSRYNYLLDENFLERDSIGFDPIINKEFENLLVMNGNAIAGDRNIPDTSKFNRLQAPGVTRVLFEWNDSEAEFNLEFFKGNEQYYIWEHNYEDNAEEILREKNYGYSVAEYIIDNSSGYKPWQINIEYLGNKSLTPTYLKVTTYNNFGSKSQNKEVKVVKLTAKNIKQELLTL
ncbi:MAG: hypothetical protein WBB27_20020, partial [Maribacter sp.]